LIALDTNILVYSAAATDDPRHLKALDLLDKLGATGAILPLPVIGEFINACRKKQLAPSELLAARLAVWTEAFDCFPATVDDYRVAAILADIHKLQYFDALIVTVARRAGAAILLSEDMQDGLEVDGLTIVNPFVVVNDAVLAERLGNAP
jgi:predicted nucleic acid-binding protein